MRLYYDLEEIGWQCPHCLTKFTHEDVSFGSISHGCQFLRKRDLLAQRVKAINDIEEAKQVLQHIDKQLAELNANFPTIS